MTHVTQDATLIEWHRNVL